MDYYYIKDDKQTGPVSEKELVNAGVNRESMIWREGLSDWVKAAEVPEILALIEAAEPQTGEAAQTALPTYYAMIGSEQTGPMTSGELIATGKMTRETLVWTEGMAEWAKAGDVDVFARFLPPGTSAGSTSHQPRQTGHAPQTTLGDPIPYSSPWMGWAIAAAVVNFLGLFGQVYPFIGMVFGILGIVYSNQAKNRYMIGLADAGRQADSTAKTMTIISLAIAGLSILGWILLIAFVGSAIGWLAAFT